MKKLIAGSLLFLMPFASMADDSWFANVQSGTLGTGVTVGKVLSEKFSIRANFNGLNTFKKDVTISDVKYNGKLKTLNAGLIFDYYPFNIDNGFKLSFGAYYNKNKINAIANEFSIGKNTYNTSDFGYFEANGSFSKLSPYFGIGYQSLKERGWNIMADLGVMYHGSFSSTAKVNCSNAICDNFKGMLAPYIENEKQSFDNRINQFKFYPVVTIGIAYVF